ncbi:MAG: 50S ribosomal protein L20 [Bacillota bacterium]|nr:50S ribosomal protein L20 [Bacillota bacterium]
MARVKGGTVTRARRKKILKAAEGYFGSKHLLFKTAKEQVLHSYRYAYISRRLLKRDMRKLWIKRINAGCHENGISYSKFMDGLKKSGISINRKMLSELAISDPNAFKGLVDTAKSVQSK